jgi:hypothetical protein
MVVFHVLCSFGFVLQFKLEKERATSFHALYKHDLVHWFCVPKLESFSGREKKERAPYTRKERFFLFILL